MLTLHVVYFKPFTIAPMQVSAVAAVTAKLLAIA
jgi:hypothetical protein